MKNLIAATALLAGVSCATLASAQDFKGPTEPAKAPSNLNVTVVTCFSVLHGCVAPADAIKEIGGKLGWNVTVLDGGGNARQQNAAMLDAVSSGANVIVNIAIDPNLVQLGLGAAKKANIPVVSGSNGIDSPNPTAKPAEGALSYAFDVAPDYAALGREAAEWIIKDSSGKAKVAVFSDKEFPSVLALQTGLLDGLKACKDCTVSDLQYFTGSQVGTTLGQQTVGYLRANPDTEYLFSPFDPAAAAQVTALQLANFGTVKVVSVLGNQQNLDFIRSGRIQVADAAYDNRYMGFAIVDQTIRLLNKQHLAEPRGEGLPFIVLNKDNLPPTGTDWTAAPDYQEKFYALWK
ncbi:MULTISPECIES: sugar ABC transporter substrate-binding protein [unclassified Rhizobium]|uniref:sugar ABC transporter substrate-binding protein n=1 Tax=unclassified Rhizobium TaxID=2613769 RepID=UPI001ADCF9C0|nr:MULTISPECIES: sugar ABC transporter substrate-binding protein [unclassified Rhizobium]MBO9127890.1 sugar ABC transporter substrate-binding protein [Rhizobium sp. 16-488-2b]MBO9178284.1 sugar ABC transporter substrate-binding protein [Rhizobium sp. 16-488-2a]